MYHFELRYTSHVCMVCWLYTKVSISDMGSWLSTYDDIFSSIEVRTHIRQEDHGCTRVGNQDGNEDISNHITDHLNTDVQVWHFVCSPGYKLYDAPASVWDTCNAYQTRNHRTDVVSHTRTIAAISTTCKIACIQSCHNNNTLHLHSMYPIVPQQ